MRNEHAMQQHTSSEMNPRERWEWWSCRCGLHYLDPDPHRGYARRSVARRLHREHLKAVAA